MAVLVTSDNTHKHCVNTHTKDFIDSVQSDMYINIVLSFIMVQQVTTEV